MHFGVASKLYDCYHDNIEITLLIFECSLDLNASQKMLTRREKLLVRPWQLRRYNNHRKKVLTALPAIDFGPPPERGHVNLKVKKLQRESERRIKIEEDNFRLLQRMAAIMKKNRLDNHWETKPPNFLRRVGVYHRTRSPTPCEELTVINSPTGLNGRKSRCVACTPQSDKPKQIPGDRIPWEPPTKSPSRRRPSTTLVITTRNSSLDAKTDQLPTRSTKKSIKCHVKLDDRNKSPYFPFVAAREGKRTSEINAEKQIIVEEGSLHLAVNFPLHVDVKVKSVNNEKYIQRGQCGCLIPQINVKKMSKA